MPEFAYQEPTPLGPSSTKYRLLTSDHVSAGSFDGTEILKVDPRALTELGLRGVSRGLVSVPDGSPGESGRDPR